jgi:ferric-dicitrate binding protein FerR (iron transport regulator)
VYHTLEFAGETTVDLEVAPQRRLERLRIRQGERLRAQVKPYVVDAEDGLVEVADLFFEDGAVTRTVRFACFSFVD